MNTERGTRWELRRSRRAMTSIALLSAAFAGAKIQDIVRGVIHDRRARGRGGEEATVAGADLPSGDSAADAAPAAPLSPPRPALTKLTRKSIGSPDAAATKQSVEEEVVVCSVCHQGVGTPSSPVTPLNHHRGPPSTPGSNTTTVNSHSGFRGVPAPKPDPYVPKPRDRYLKWDDYFMSVAFLSAQRSKDPNKQVGAVIVGPDRVIMGVGYNGFPRGCSDSDLPWAKKSANGDPMETKYAYVCHAEMNAIMNKNSQSLHGATLYVTMYPCNECAKLIIQSGIREVVYFEGKLPMARGGRRTQRAAGDGASDVVGDDRRYRRMAETETVRPRHGVIGSTATSTTRIPTETVRAIPNTIIGRRASRSLRASRSWTRRWTRPSPRTSARPSRTASCRAFIGRRMTFGGGRQSRLEESRSRRVRRRRRRQRAGCRTTRRTRRRRSCSSWRG